MEVPIYPHVALVGAQAIRAGRELNRTDEQIALAVYLAMDEMLHVTYLSGGEEIH